MGGANIPRMETSKEVVGSRRIDTELDRKERQIITVNRKPELDPILKRKNLITDIEQALGCEYGNVSLALIEKPIDDKNMQLVFLLKNKTDNSFVKIETNVAPDWREDPSKMQTIIAELTKDACKKYQEKKEIHYDTRITWEISAEATDPLIDQNNIFTAVHARKMQKLMEFPFEGTNQKAKEALAENLKSGDIKITFGECVYASNVGGYSTLSIETPKNALDIVFKHDRSETRPEIRIANLIKYLINTSPAQILQDNTQTKRDERITWTNRYMPKRIDMVQQEKEVNPQRSLVIESDNRPTVDLTPELEKLEKRDKILAEAQGLEILAKLNQSDAKQLQITANQENDPEIKTQFLKTIEELKKEAEKMLQQASVLKEKAQKI